MAKIGPKRLTFTEAKKLAKKLNPPMTILFRRDLGEYRVFRTSGGKKARWYYTDSVEDAYNTAVQESKWYREHGESNWHA